MHVNTKLLCCSLALWSFGTVLGCGTHRGLPQGAGHKTPTHKTASDAAVSDAAGDARDAGEADAAADAASPSLNFDDIGSPVEVASTFSLAESPNWDHCTDTLLFVDVDNAIIHTLKDGEIGVFMEDSGCTNGMAFDADGNLILAQMGCGPAGRVSRRSRDGDVTVLAQSGPMDAALHTPDDVAVRSDGTIYFTDGDFPHSAHALNLSSLFTPLPIYRITPDGTIIQEDVTVGPNGIELSPDEKTLYVSSYFGGQILKYAVADDGSLQPDGTLVTGVATPDSMCLDVQGNVYLGVATGLMVIAPDGTQLGTIPMQTPKGGPTSCGFGGPDGKTLYVSDWTTLFEIDDMPIQGLGWTIDQKFDCP